MLRQFLHSCFHYIHVAAQQAPQEIGMLLNKVKCFCRFYSIKDMINPDLSIVSVNLPPEDITTDNNQKVEQLYYVELCPMISLLPPKPDLWG